MRIPNRDKKETSQADVKRTRLSQIATGKADRDNSKLSEDDEKKLIQFHGAAQELEQGIKELEAKMALPLVEPDGDSDCPFAEHLYAQKEEAEAKLVHTMSWFEDLLPVLDRKVERCRRNRSLVHSHAEMLNGVDPKKKYESAKRGLQQQYQEALDERKQAGFLLEKAKLVLARSQSLKFPGKIPGVVLLLFAHRRPPALITSQEKRR